MFQTTTCELPGLVVGHSEKPIIHQHRWGNSSKVRRLITGKNCPKWDYDLQLRQALDTA